jgi:o-succinylbenzoate synthase
MRRRATMRAFSLPLERPLATAHGLISERLGWLIELEDGEGRRGFGEATPLPDFGTENLAACRLALEEGLRAWVGNADGLSQTSSRRALDPLPTITEADAPCARSGLDAARYDLAAKRSGRSLAAEVRGCAGLAGQPADSVAVQALVEGVDPAAVEESARALMRLGFRSFKLKLAVTRGVQDAGLDVERVAVLRSAVGPEACLRLDANEAWGREEAAAALVSLERFGIDYVEQPVRRDDLAGLARLAREGAIPVAADEALLGLGLANCLEARAASILIVKPAAIGGISNALALWKRAQDEGLRVVWSTLIDAAVGRAAPLALAAGLGPIDEIHGVGTAGLLAADLADESGPDRLDAKGRLRVSGVVGIGFEPVIPAASGAIRGAAAAAAFDRGVDGSSHALEPVFEVEA